MERQLLNEQSPIDLIRKGEVKKDTVKQQQPTPVITPNPDNSNQNKQDQNKQDQNKQDQNKQDQNKQDQNTDKQDQNKQDQNKKKNPVNKAGKLIISDKAKGDWISPYLIYDLKRAVKTAKIGDVVVTGAKTGHSYYIKDTDIISNHMYGIAVDISMFIVNSKRITFASNPKLFTTLGNLYVSSLKSLGYQFGEGGSKIRGYLWQTMTGGDHYNHIHISNKNGIKQILKNLDFLQNVQQYVNHKRIISAIDWLHKFISKDRDASEYFSEYRSIFGDDESGAAERFKRGAKVILTKYKLNNPDNLDLSTQDKENLKHLNDLIKLLYKSLKSDSLTAYTLTYNAWSSLYTKWEKKSLNFNWDYFKN